jgi:hypothetical protein
MMSSIEEEDEENTELESDEAAQMLEIQIGVSDEIVLEEGK